MNCTPGLNLFKAHFAGKEQQSGKKMERAIQPEIPSPSRGTDERVRQHREAITRHGRMPYRMIPSMSRPGNPYDNASCESFMKTLKREEIYANDYRDLEHAVRSVEAFIEHYYNRCRLHSALGYRPPEEFEGKSERQDVGPDLAASRLALFDP
jgi:transposase InsO family protein